MNKIMNFLILVSVIVGTFLLGWSILFSFILGVIFGRIAKYIVEENRKQQKLYIHCDLCKKEIAQGIAKKSLLKKIEKNNKTTLIKCVECVDGHKK